MSIYPTTMLVVDDAVEDPDSIQIWSRKEPGYLIGTIFQPHHMSFKCWAAEGREGLKLACPDGYWRKKEDAIAEVIAAENKRRAKSTDGVAQRAQP